MPSTGSLLLYMCPHTAIRVSAYCYICVCILLYVCPHTAVYVSAYCYICVLILLYMCPPIAISVSYRQQNIWLCGSWCGVLAYGHICVLILAYCYISALQAEEHLAVRCVVRGLCIRLHTCPHTAIYVVYRQKNIWLCGAWCGVLAHCYICVLILAYCCIHVVQAEQHLAVRCVVRVRVPRGRHQVRCRRRHCDG